MTIEDLALRIISEKEHRDLMFGTFMSVTTNTEDDVRFPLVMSYIDIKYMIKPLARSLAGIDALVNYI